MKILCSLSGIEFNAEHFPGTFYSREISHPIFYLPQKRLLSYTGKWASGELTRTDSYLLFLALLNSSEQVEFRSPVFRNEQTDSLVALNMESLVRTVIKINAVRNPSVTFPRFAITHETRFLSNVHHWIEAWKDAYTDFENGTRRDYETRKLIHREAALQRMIKNPHKDIREYAAQLAEWAAVAGEFPTFPIQSPWNSLKISCAEYWKAIIIRAAKNEFLHSVSGNDLQELLEHCEDKIPVGSIYSHALFKLLRHAKERLTNYLGFGDVDLRSTYTLLDESTTIEAANIKAMVDSAPLTPPRPEEYPNKFKYLQAKLKWDMARKYEKEQNSASTAVNRSPALDSESNDEEKF
jgi:hypothetical protein